MDYKKLEEEPPMSGEGLTSAQAEEQCRRWGKNEIPEEKEPLWRMFAMQFVGTMPAMIEIAGLLWLILGSYVDVWWSGSSSDQIYFYSFWMWHPEK